MTTSFREMQSQAAKENITASLAESCIKTALPKQVHVHQNSIYCLLECLSTTKLCRYSDLLDIKFAYKLGRHEHLGLRVS